MIQVAQWFGRQRYAMLALLGCVLMTLLMIIMLLEQSDERAFEATFLEQCHDAGYDPAKCRFFLTATSRRVSAEVVQEVVLTPK